MREHVTVNRRWTTVGSLQYFQTWQIIVLIFFVSFSINDWKENVESLNNSPFWEETQSFIFFCQLTVNETVFFCRFLQMLSTAATIEVSDVYLQCSVPCHVNSLARTVFENICFPFYLHKLTSIFRQSWSCEEIPKLSQVHKTVTIAASFSSEWSIKTLLRAYESQLQ